MDKTILIYGQSGTGKTTLAKVLEEEYGYYKLVTHTTRKPRDGEVNGRDYHFVSEEEFKATNLLEQDFFAGNHYGLSVSELSDSPSKSYAILTPSGVDAVLRLCKEVNVVRVTSSEEDIKQRLVDCGRSERIAQSIPLELSEPKVVYEIVNSDLEDAKNQMRKIAEEILYGGVLDD